MTMPEKIWVHDFVGDTATAIKDNNSYATEYVHGDLYETLEAEKKRLAVALDFYGQEFGYNCPTKECDAKICVMRDKGQHARESLAQRIGGK